MLFRSGSATSSSFNAVTATGLGDVASISAGYRATCAILNTGAASCWGRSNQQGNGARGAPVLVSGISGASALSANTGGCAVTAGSVKCWGSGRYGQLGNGGVGDSAVPVAVTGVTTATAVSSGARHSCARLANGTVQCWGENSFGGLGNASALGFSAVPVTVTGISTATAVSVGYRHTCAVLVGGSVQCWGLANSGQLGVTVGTSTSTPQVVPGISTATGIAAGDSFTCALLSGGGVQCWGDNTSAQLGSGTTSAGGITRVNVASVTSATAITAGGTYACALLTNQTRSEERRVGKEC